jgi:hypothetical protein
MDKEDDMIFAWETDENGKVAGMWAFNTDAELKELAKTMLAEGRKLHAGDVKEFSLGFIPADVTIKRP